MRLYIGAEGWSLLSGGGSFEGEMQNSRLIITLAAVAASAIVGIGAVSAADLPARTYTKAPVMESVYNWTGFYVGGTVGGAFGSFDPNTTVGTGTYFAPASVVSVNAAGLQNIKPAGFTGGFEAGYNWQFNNLVLGLEGDIEYLGQKGSATSTGGFPGFTGAFALTSSTSTTWLATARARAGIAANDWLFFGTGGAAFSNIKANFVYSDNCGAIAGCNGPGVANGAEASAFSSMKTGFAVGAGVEKAIGPNWTVKAEYLYVNFGTVTGAGLLTGPFGTTQNLAHNFDLKDNIVRLGVNYKWGGPMVAKGY